MSSKTTKPSLLNFVLSDHFDDYIIDVVNDTIKSTVKSYLNWEIKGTDNEPRFTMHDMNRGNVKYLRQIVSNLIKSAEAIVMSMPSEDERDQRQKNDLVSKLNSKKDKILMY